MHWKEIPIYVIDFEGSRGSGILEYGVVTLQGGTVAEVTTRLCAAAGPIDARDSAVHGLGAAETAGAAPFAADWDRFAGWRATGPFAAHFASAENSLLKSVWPYGRLAPDFARPGATTVEWGPWIDTGRLLPQAIPGLASLRLKDLVAALGVQPELDRLAGIHCPAARRRFHAAAYDALAAALLLLALLRRPEFVTATIPWLLARSRLDPAARAELEQGRFF